MKKGGGRDGCSKGLLQFQQLEIWLEKEKEREKIRRKRRKGRRKKEEGRGEEVEEE